MSLIIIIIALLLSVPSMAATFTFIGSNKESDDPSNWDLNEVPADADDVIIPIGAEAEINEAAFADV